MPPPYPAVSERTRDGIAAARKRGRRPGRPPLDREMVSAAQTLIEAGLDAQASREAAGHRQDYGLQDRQGTALKPHGQFTPLGS